MPFNVTSERSLIQMTQEVVHFIHRPRNNLLNTNCVSPWVSTIGDTKKHIVLKNLRSR